MQLSHVDIELAIAEKRLVFVPALEPEAIDSDGVTLRLGRTIRRQKPTGKPLCLRKGDVPEFDDFDLRKEPYFIKRGEFVLGHTLELVTIGLDLAGHATGRSLMARCSVSVEKAKQIRAGHGFYEPRTITLEIDYMGPDSDPMELYEGMPVLNLYFIKLLTPATRPADERGRHRHDTGGLVVVKGNNGM